MEVLGIGSSVAYSVGKPIIIATITTIYSVLSRVLHREHSNVITELDEMDVVGIIQIVEEFISNNEHGLLSNDVTGSNKHAHDFYIEKIHEIIVKIHDDLTQIEHICDEHDNKWFSYWRTLDCSEQLNRINTNITILIRRFDLVCKAVSQQQILSKPKNDSVLSVARKWLK